MELKYYEVGEVIDTPIGRVGVVEDSKPANFAWTTTPVCYGCAFYHSRLCKLHECLSWNRPDSKSVHFELIDDKNGTNGTKNL